MSQETEPGGLLASISVTESAHAGVLRKKNGFFFHIRTPPGIVGPVLDGYEFRDGKEIDSFGGGSGSAEVIAAIGNIGLAPFDFQREVEDLTARLTREGIPARIIWQASRRTADTESQSSPNAHSPRMHLNDLSVMEGKQGESWPSHPANRRSRFPSASRA